MTLTLKLEISTIKTSKTRLRSKIRLEALIRAALVEPKVRKKTRPTRASKERRIEAKKQRGTTKRQRQGGGWD